MAKRQQSFDPRQNMLGLQMEAFHNYDDADRVVDLHHHDFYEIYYFISGDVEYRVEGKTYILQKGDLLLISPGVFHQPLVRSGVPYERIVLWINRGSLAQFAEQGGDLAACFDPAGPWSWKSFAPRSAATNTAKSCIATPFLSRS